MIGDDCWMILQTHRHGTTNYCIRRHKGTVGSVNYLGDDRHELHFFVGSLSVEGCLRLLVLTR